MRWKRDRRGLNSGGKWVERSGREVKGWKTAGKGVEDRWKGCKRDVRGPEEGWKL